ncbi:MAG: hypothetical protein ACL93V_08470 [Candidatus Electrothrix sp. YB6]
MRLKILFYDIQLSIVRYRTVLTVVFTAVSSLFLGLFLATPTPLAKGVHWNFFISFIFSNALLVFVSITPKYYERIRFIAELLPVIFKILELDRSSRVVLHHIRNQKTQTYEQVTDYYPARTGRGRKFVFTQGITGQAFRTRRPQLYSIPDEVKITDDYQSRWAFTEDEISRLTQDRKSFYAFPIGQAGEYAKAILYMDSSDPNMFSKGREEKLNSTVKMLFLPLLERLLNTNGSGKD